MAEGPFKAKVPELSDLPPYTQGAGGSPTDPELVMLLRLRFHCHSSRPFSQDFMILVMAMYSPHKINSQNCTHIPSSWMAPIHG